MTVAQERLLGPQGKLHPAEYTITELALVETTDDDPAKVSRPPTRAFWLLCASGCGLLLWRVCVLQGRVQSCGLCKHRQRAAFASTGSGGCKVCNRMGCGCRHCDLCRQWLQGHCIKHPVTVLMQHTGLA